MKFVKIKMKSAKQIKLKILILNNKMNNIIKIILNKKIKKNN